MLPLEQTGKSIQKISVLFLLTTYDFIIILINILIKKRLAVKYVWFQYYIMMILPLKNKSEKIPLKIRV